jgi:hypothetical protein
MSVAPVGLQNFVLGMMANGRSCPRFSHDRGSLAEETFLYNSDLHPIVPGWSMAPDLRQVHEQLYAIQRISSCG